MKNQDSIAVANFVIERALDRKKPVTKSCKETRSFKDVMNCFFRYWASAPIENKAAYFSCNENRLKEVNVDEKLAKKLNKITNKMLDYDRRNKNESRI